MRKIAFILLWVLALVSCVRQEMDPHELSEASAGAVTIPFTVAGEELAGPSTRSVELGEDTPLESLHIAVFGSSGYLKEYVKAKDLVRSDTTYIDRYGISRTVALYHFNVTLPLTDSRRIIHFIGNGPSMLSFGYADALLPQVLSGTGQRSYWQKKTIDGIRARKSHVEGSYIDGNGNQVFKGDYIDRNGNKVVDGKSYVPDQATLNAFRGIPLVKNWAKITLSSAEDSHFTPYSYAIINVPSRGTVAPYSAATAFVSDYQTLSFEQLVEMDYKANLPVGVPFDTSIPSAEDFQNHTGGVVSVGEGAVYLYERPVPTSEMPPSSIIVYGHYQNPDDPDNEGDYYYKVDLMEGDEYYPIFRNFEYEVKVVSITSKGHHNPVAAAAAAGSADVSADINASHLADISDGTARLIVTPWMARTFTSRVTDGVLGVFFVDDVIRWHINMGVDSVIVEKLPMPYGAADIIDQVSVDPPLENVEGSEGWRTLHFTTVEPGTTARTQTLRITGLYETGRLYRDVQISLLPVQPMKVRCTQRKIADEVDTYQCVEIVIPQGLESSMFPLEFWIEPERMTLTPDATKVNNNLPVSSGPSISENEDQAGKPTFHFMRTLSWEEYRTLATERDEDSNTWRVLPCHFKTNCTDNETAVWVQNEFFHPAHDQFFNLRDLTFRNLGFTAPIRRQEGHLATVHFTVDTTADGQYPEDYPVITLEAFQMEPVSDDVLPVQGMPGVYRFKPTSSSVDLTFRTTTDSGELELVLMADDYTTQVLRSHFFQGAGFIDGHRLWKSTSSWSNVACGHVNYDKTKTVLFGYFDDPAAPNVEIFLENLVGLNPRNPTSYPNQPTGPRSTVGVQTYHELEFTTPSAYSLDPVSFTLCANGYVEEKIRAGRFQGNILTQDQITTSNVLKPGNNVGFSVDHPSFTMKQDPSKTPTFTLSFDSISDLRSVQPQGVILNAGGSYTITLTSNTAEYYMFYFQFNIRTGYNWNGTRRDLAPVSIHPSVGEVYFYPGDNKQYVWNLPKETTTATLTLTAAEDYPINITDMIVKSYKATFHY